MKGQYSEERGSKRTEKPLSYVLKIRSALLLDSTLQHNTDQQRGTILTNKIAIILKLNGSN